MYSQQNLHPILYHLKLGGYKVHNIVSVVKHCGDHTVMEKVFQIVGILGIFGSLATRQL
jgi:hypothetical protein